MKEKVPVAPVAVSVARVTVPLRSSFRARPRGGDRNPSIQRVRRVRSNDCRNSHDNFLVLPREAVRSQDIQPARGKS